MKEIDDSIALLADLACPRKGGGIGVQPIRTRENPSARTLFGESTCAILHNSTIMVGRWHENRGRIKGE